MSVNGTLVEDKMRRFKGECPHFSFNTCPINAHDGASAKFSPNSQETNNSAASRGILTESTKVSFETVRVPIVAVFEMCKGRQIFACRSSEWSCTGHENACSSLDSACRGRQPIDALRLL